MAQLIKSLLSFFKITHAQPSPDEGAPALLPEAQSAQKSAFTSLSPVDNADSLGQYAVALDWALKNEGKGDVKNIALTGPYGSGKSSILKTYQSKNTDPNLTFLNISLATFKEELDPNSQTKSTDLLRLIELSILQQIFYHEEDHKIPDSRFKKIRSFRRNTLIYNSIGIFLVLASSIYLFDKSFFQSLSGYYPISIVKKLAPPLSISIVAAGVFYAIFRSIRTVSSITISKLNFQNAEIQISDSISKSILNNHLDEILYFFEVTKYSVVVIEDLDRFEQTEIFTKLRELNHLLNYSEKIKRDIVFIYAVRDDIFKNKDRTKFFDFIIPVIPVINSSNSNEKLLDIIAKNSYGIKTELVENISLFIDDLRLLYNITNEYHIYRLKLGNLNQDRLFAMMVYKNMYPDDFVDLSNGKGKLFGVFEEKETFIKERTEAIRAQIEDIRLKIRELDDVLISNKQELRQIYIYKYIENLTNITKFVIQEKDYNFSDVTTDELFVFFLKDKISYSHISPNYNGNYRLNTNTVDLKFSDIQDMVSDEYTYEERLNNIFEIQNNKQEDLKEQIRKLEKERTKIRHHKIHEITALGGCRMNFEDNRQSQLVNILLRNAYIGEDYLDYISIFYEGSITKSDRDFLLNVKAQTPTDFDYKLVKIEKLIPKIDAIDFSSSNILNYNLLDYILGKDKYLQQCDAMLNILKNESAVAVGFIDGFIDATLNTSTFINLIAKRWPNIWRFLTQRSNYTKERLDLYLALLLEYAELDSIKTMATKSKLSSEISSMTHFPDIWVSADKFKPIIEGLNLKFTSLDLVQVPVELARFIYEQNHYSLTEEMVKTVINCFGKYNDIDFKTRNFFAIKNSECKELISYIDKNISIYMNNIYLMEEQNIFEEEPEFIELLNRDDLLFEQKEALLDKVTTLVADVDAITSIDIVQSLLERSKITPTWHNLVSYYHSMDNILDAYAVDFIENTENAQALSATRIKAEVSLDEDTIVKPFTRDLLLEESFSNETYALVILAAPYIYGNLNFGDLSTEKVRLLIKNKKLKLSTVHYDLLRTEFNGLHLELAEQASSEFIPKINDYTVEEPEIIYLLSSSHISIEEKNNIIELLGSDMISSTSQLLTVLGTLCSNDQRLVIPDGVLNKVLRGRLPAIHKITLLIRKAETLNKEQIREVLESLPEPYSDIAKLGRRPKLDVSTLNWELARKLEKLGVIKRASDEKGRIRISTFRQ
jgi:hypothetical protein